MLDFNCKNCGKKITVPRSYAGKKGKCPNCKTVVTVPEIEEDTLLELKDSDDGQQQTPPQPEIRLEQEASSQDRIDCFSADRLGLVKDEPPKRKYPPIIDVFLYPMTAMGLVTIGMFWILIEILRWLPIPLFAPTALFLVYSYIYYFFIDCIQDSAEGQIRVPTGIGTVPEISDAFSKMVKIIVSAIICWGPLFVYLAYNDMMDWLHSPFFKSDTIFAWILFGYGFFFFPISLLALTIFDSTLAFNPFLWITSIARTFYQYCSLVAVLLVLYFLGLGLKNLLRGPILSSLYLAVYIYMIIVKAHLIGRFYYRNSQKLNWQ